MKFVTRGFADGTDFIGTDDFYSKTKKAGRGGFGDMICEISNLYAQTKEADTEIVPRGAHSGKVHPGYKDFIQLIDMEGRNYRWSTSSSLSSCKTNDDIVKSTGRKLLMPYPDYPYVQVVKDRLEAVSGLPDQYITYQSKGLAGKCGYDRDHVTEAYKRFRESYGVECFDVHNAHKRYSTSQIAYIIDNAIAHVGIDSGMTHFALCIKKKEDVIIIVPKDKITGVSYRWINQGYKVQLV